ncbi:hypothetical protein Pan44_48320 [Caulifigura coniformis]|uniref:Uncharacterized protein n=1 Tax=Caulifigura coniformis TaxID=2527983 RepID=A0A517SKX7_9PLAN|nr:hypothetical protein [Caulifigura coniformis]QDT56772.1 hypothetical protein Pan44_48320 [Caulifigura coniformis]
MAGRWLIVIVVAASISGRSNVDAAGILGRVRGEVNESSSGGGSDQGGNSSSSCDDEDDGLFGDVATWITLRVVTSPFTLPIVFTDDQYERDAAFDGAPYQSNPKGYVTLTESPDSSREWAGRLSIDSGGNFDDLFTLSGRLQLEHRNRFGIDASWTNLNERVPGGRDDMTLGDANVVFRFAQSETALFYTGLGFNWLEDHGDFDAGFNFTYGADWFPAKPLVVSSSIDLGGLGGASFFRSRTTVGALIERFEIYTGFDYLNVEGVDIPTGVAGLRVWY